MIIVRGDVVEVKLTRGLVAIIDAEDAERVCQHKWCAIPGPNTHYASRRSGKTSVMMHRVILNAQPGTEIDHINRNGLDNRKANLRYCTRSQNVANSRTASKTGKSSVFKGVWFRREKKYTRPWRALIRKGGKRYSSHHHTELEAALAYDELARQHFGEFARTNFP